jgi:hypothetical protein
MAEDQHRNLDLTTDPSFQSAEWRAQRLGWIVWSLVLLAAALGLLGPGWLSDVEHRSTDGKYTIRYERFLHYHNPSQLEVYVTHPPRSGEWTIKLDRALLDRVQIERIEPEAERSVIEADGVSYVFQSDAEAASGRSFFTLSTNVTEKARELSHSQGRRLCPLTSLSIRKTQKR